MIPPTVQTNTDTVLNEVLSLNAQEFFAVLFHVSAA